MIKEYLRSHEVAEMLGISKRHLANLKRDKVIPYYQFGKIVRYKREDVLAHIEANTLKKREVSHG